MAMTRWAVGAATAMALTVSRRQATPQEVVLKFSTFMAPQSAVWLDMHEGWMKKVEKDSNGRIKFERYPAMQLGGTPGQLYDQVKDGVADVTWTLPGTTAGRFPRVEVFELPVHDDQRRGHLQGVLGVRADLRQGRVQGRAPARRQRPRPGHVPLGHQADQVDRRPEGHEGARPDAADHQAAGLARRNAGRHAAARHSRRTEQGRDRRGGHPVGGRAVGQGSTNWRSTTPSSIRSCPRSTRRRS